MAYPFLNMMVILRSFQELQSGNQRMLSGEKV